MNPFNRLPGSRRTASGLEWSVLKKLPAILLAGTFLCGAFILLLQAGWLDLSEKGNLKAQYATIGVMLFHWISMLIVALICVIVVIMKGHAYVRDAYPLPDDREAERPRSKRR